MERRSKQTFFQRHIDGQQVCKKMLNITNHQRNANQNLNEISPHTCRMAIIKRREITNVGEDVEKMNPHALLVGM